MGNTSSKYNDENHSLKTKLLLMGKARVGKSSIISSFQDGNFSQEYIPTLGCQLVNLTVPYSSHINQLLVMDSLTDADLTLSCRLKSIKNTEIIAIIFDLTDQESWNDVDSKLSIIKNNEYRHKTVLLIGNKSDCDILIDNEQIHEYILNYKEFKLEYFIVSARTGENIKNFFTRSLQHFNIIFFKQK